MDKRGNRRKWNCENKDGVIKGFVSQEQKL